MQALTIKVDFLKRHFRGNTSHMSYEASLECKLPSCQKEGNTEPCIVNVSVKTKRKSHYSCFELAELGEHILLDTF